MKSEMIRISEPSKFKIDTAKVDENHIYLLIDSSSEISATQIVRKLKQGLRFQFGGDFPRCSRNTFWTDGYFISTTGQASEETIRKYIENQG